jgi:hypothetical protein
MHNILTIPIKISPWNSKMPLAGQESKLNSESFWSFVWKERPNRAYLLIAVTATIVQFTIFKILYPFPDFFSDSYSYIYAASANLDINIWPIGYSKFLRAFHWLTYSDKMLTGFQYFFIELTALYFFYTLLFFVNISRKYVIVLFIFLFLNPLFLYLSNYVNSDPLFYALSLLWFTELIWILYKPRTRQMFIQGFLLLLCFTVRNNAYYYPIISLVAIFLSKHLKRNKLLGCLLTLLPILAFIHFTKKASKDMTGTAQYSIFTGWQLANNALYMYSKLDANSLKFTTPETKELDSLSQSFYKKVVPNFTAILANYTGNFFIRQSDGPLKQYLKMHYNIVDDKSEILAWAKSSPVFKYFGSHLIEKYPLKFISFFILPNIRNYLTPPLEKLKIYNLGSDKINHTGSNWFNLSDPRVYCISKSLQGEILAVYPTIFLFLNVLCFTYIILLVTRSKSRSGRESILLLTLASTLIITNFLFCIVSTIVVFRYEIFPMTICLFLSLLFIDWYDKMMLLQKSKVVQ